MSLFKTWGVGIFIVLTVHACTSKKALVNPSLLVGQWLSTRPQTVPHLVIDSNRNFSILLGDPPGSDTVGFNFRLKGSTLTLFSGSKWWISKNDIIKLSTDSLVYRRKGDGAIFRYRRNGL